LHSHFTNAIFAGAGLEKIPCKNLIPSHSKLQCDQSEKVTASPPIKEQSHNEPGGRPYPLSHSTSMPIYYDQSGRLSRSSSVTSESYYPSSSDLETEEDFEDTWSDTFEDNRFRDVTGETTPTVRRRSRYREEEDEDDDSDVTPRGTMTNPMDDLMEAAHKLNMTVQLSPEKDSVRVKEAAGARSNRRDDGSGSSSSTSRTSSGTRKKQRAPTAPAAVQQSNIPMQYPRPQSRTASRTTSRTTSPEGASSAVKLRSRGGPMVLQRPSSRLGDAKEHESSRPVRQGRPFAAVESGQRQPEQDERELFIKETQVPMQMWSRRQSYVTSVEDRQPSAPPPPAADEPRQPDDDVSGSSPSSSSSPRCPHCTIHSWLPHATSCPKNVRGGGARRK
jgi:hypothetical protein